MKSIRFLTLYLILSACLSSGFSVRAQQAIPDRPFIDKVSVDPITGDVTIIWGIPVPQMSNVDVDEFVLYWYDLSLGAQPFETIPYTAQDRWVYTFNYSMYPSMPDPRNSTVLFTVTADHKDPYSRSTLALRHSNLYVINKYDSCKSEIRLQWNTYGTLANNGFIQPNEHLIGYNVMQILDDGNHEIIKTLADTDTSYVVPRVNENNQYVFYIKAIQSNGEESFCYRTEKFTQMPIQPSFIIADNTQYNGDGLAEISFRLDPAAETYLYEFYGSDYPDYAFVSLGRYNIHGDTVLTDNQKRGKTHYYKLEAWHICENKISSASNTATALWMTHKQFGQTNSLWWKPYSDWGGNAEYKLHRQIGTNPEEVIKTFTDPETTAWDDDLTGFFIDGRICYWITAAPSSPKSGEEFAISNTICLEPESDIFIPQAFTPKDPGPDPAAPNNLFKPYFSYLPQDVDDLNKMEYFLYVYDRFGAKVFETKDVNTGWDGRFMNGKPASEGVYVYFISYRTANGRVIEKKGKFVLLLP